MDATHLNASPAAESAAPREYSATGVNGTVTVRGRWVTIRKGLVPRSFGIRGGRQIAIADIAAVHLDPPTTDTQGSLQLVLGSDAPVDPQVGPASDEYTVRFTQESAAAFEQVRVCMQAALDDRTAPAQTAA